MRSVIGLFLATGLMISACTMEQLKKAEQASASAIMAVQAACDAAAKAKTVSLNMAHGGALETVQKVALYVDATCNTAQAISAVAQDPGTVAWLNNLAVTMSTTAALAK